MAHQLGDDALRWDLWMALAAFCLCASAV